MLCFSVPQNSIVTRKNLLKPWEHSSHPVSRLVYGLKFRRATFSRGHCGYEYA